MSTVGQKEIMTQKRVIRLFRDDLGYRYLGHWQDREGNSNIEEDLLTGWLERQGHSAKVITKVLEKIDKAAVIGSSRRLYDANRAVYSLLRYGVKIKPEVAGKHDSIWLIDWHDIDNNDFAIAEEVTVTGVNTKRPDIVLYVNGIAIGVLELKRSIVSVAEGIRQNLDSQKKKFIQPFFATVQLVMAGNDTEGLRYGVIETPEKHFRAWKEESPVENPLDRALGQICRKERLLEIVHDFIIFDAGTKKICRPNQYFGVRAAQEHVRRREAGIIWHTQGSGKSLTMVWLARWIRERMKDPPARILIITDRNELDEQIEKVFNGVDEKIYRTTSGADLVNVLNRSEEWLICSLVHKFGRSDEADLEAYIKEIEDSLPQGFHAKGELFVFVDECHRTQSGKLHDAMKAIVPGAMLIGFTGTPLLKKDKKKSIEVFGPYIHTYKYDEAVRDGVVLDLLYEARDIDQSISSQEKIDQWFELKTRGLNDVARAQLKRRWGTMKKVLSAKSRLEMIVSDILLDMETRDRLMNGRGNAMLVSGSIYSACRFFEMLQRTDLAGKCAIVTSYRPSPSDIKGEETGEGLTEKLNQYEIYRKMLAAHFDEPEKKAMYKVEQFEKEVKKRFVEEPGQMRLLIVVDKLLTGFDAPSATYLYIDKQMRDHGLFQAICRVNRIDGDDKEYGYVIDYKDLFKSLAKSIREYTGEAFDEYDRDDVAGLLKNRLEEAQQRLDERRELIKALCEPVEPPRDTLAYLRYFGAAASDDPEALERGEKKRLTLYKLAGELLRAYANIANEIEKARYTESEIKEIKAEVDHFQKVRDEVRYASGDYIDMKRYEPSMRHLLDTYIRAEDSEVLSTLNDMTLVELVVERGEEAFDSLPKGVRGSKEAMAEAIENNVRRLIIDEMSVNPKYYEKMSQLLDALIQERKQEALTYKEYLKKIVDLTKNVCKPETQLAYPAGIDSPALRSLYDNLDQKSPDVSDEKSHTDAYVAEYGDAAKASRAIAIDKAIRKVKKAGWRGNRFKEREVRIAIMEELGDDDRLVDEIFEIVKSQRDY
jgi:type I restriction enzyme R subunit